MYPRLKFQIILLPSFWDIKYFMCPYLEKWKSISLLGNGGSIATILLVMEGGHGLYLQPESYRNRLRIVATGAKYHLLPGCDTVPLKILRLLQFSSDLAEILA